MPKKTGAILFHDAAPGMLRMLEMPVTSGSAVVSAASAASRRPRPRSSRCKEQMGQRLNRMGFGSPCRQV